MNFDVIVVGGGPAGLAAAITCQQHGVRTLVVEAERCSSERPGETLHPGVEGVFRRLGVLGEIEQAGFLRHTGYYVRRGPRVILQRYGSDSRRQWKGFQAVRTELDAILLTRALSAGATIRRDRGIEPLVESGRPVGVRTTGGTFEARFLIDAAGPGHWLQRYLGLAALQASDPLITSFGWTSIEDGVMDLPEFDIRGCGWTWRARVQAERCAWVSLELDRRIEARTERARDVTWRIVRPCAGRGYFLVGDAAYVLDPACSHGVLKALMSGILAGIAIAESLKGGKSEASAARASYCAWMEKWFCSDAAALVELYSRFVPSPAWLPSAREVLRYISMNPFL